MNVSVLSVSVTLVLGSCLLAGDARGQNGNSANTDAERQFMSWQSTLPPQTLEGYHTALYCNVANDVAQVFARKAGDERAVHRFELGSEKSWIFARRTAEQLGLIEADHGATDSAEVKKMVQDPTYFRDALTKCRQVGLVYDESSTQSETPGPDRGKTQDVINQKFIRWSQGWAMDHYLPGTARIDNLSCGAGGCEADGRFSFSRGAAVLTIPFSAQIARVGEGEYALGRLCYNDTTVGMRDCVD